MKKTILLVALLLAAPAMAVDLSCVIVDSGGGNGTLTISYDASTEPNLVRAFALDVEVTGAVMAGVASTNADYYIYPGTIVIDANGDPVTYGTPVAPANDPGALGALPGTQCTIEMGSLYESGAPAPNDTDVLIVFNLTGMAASGEASVSTNETRGMIVLESAVSVDANTTCSFGGKCLVVGQIVGGVLITQNMYDLWISLGEPPSWCYDCHFRGDVDDNGIISTGDLLGIPGTDGWSQAWNVGYNPQSDTDNSGVISTGDLLGVTGNDGWSKGWSLGCP